MKSMDRKMVCLDGTKTQAPDDEAKIKLVNIVYATEWGTCERLGERLLQRLAHLPCCVRTIAIEDFDIAQNEIDLPPQEVFHVFIVSTIGQGDPPTNAVEFMKRLKKHRYHIPQALVIGNGHSAFDTYNAFGVELHKKLQKYANTVVLNPKPILIDCADTSFEEVFVDRLEPFIPQIESMIDSNKGLEVRAAVESQQCDLVLSEDISECWPVQKNRGKPSKVMDKPLFECEKCEVSEHKFVGRQRGAHLISVKYPGMLDTTVGQAVRLWAPCPDYMISLAEDLFGVKGRYCIADQVPRPANGKYIYPKGISLTDVFRYVVDWTSVPVETLMLEILTLADVSNECSPKIVAEVLARKLTLYELLRHLKDQGSFAARTLPLALLVKFPRIKPRAYTLASSVVRDGLTSTTIQLFINEACTERNRDAIESAMIAAEDVHHGRVSLWLKTLREAAFTIDRAVLLTTMSSICNIRHAVHGGVWCGAGSGCSMFRGFLDERRRVFERIRKQPPAGPNTAVYLSLRSREEFDLINEKGLFEFAVREGLVAGVTLCLTREPVGMRLWVVTKDGLESVEAPVERPYISDVLKAKKPAALDWLTGGADGHFIICGGVWLKEGVVEAIGASAHSALQSSYRLVAEVW